MNKTKLTRPRSLPHGTAILGRVIPELAICGCFGMTDTEALFVAESISKTILSQFQIDLLQASGLIGMSSDED